MPGKSRPRGNSNEDAGYPKDKSSSNQDKGWWNRCE